MKKELSIRHLVIVTMNLRLLQFLIKKKVLSAFLDNCEKRMFEGYLVSRYYGMDNKKIQSYYTEKTDSRYRRLLLLGTFSRRS